MRRDFRWKFALAGVILVLAATGAGAAVITFREGVSPTAGYTTGGVTIRSDQATTNQNSSAQIIVGQNTGTGTLRGLLEFDLSAIKAAAAGGTITINSVILTGTTVAASSGTGNVAYNASLLGTNSNFDETAVTWTSAPNTAGGTIGTLLSTSNAIDIAAASATAVFPTSVAFVSAAQSAASNAANNNLNLILTSPGDGNTAIGDFARFASDENTATASRPSLTVDYTVTPAPEPASLGLLGLAAIGLFGRRRRRMA